MAIKIVSGRSKSGKSKYIYDTITSLVESGEEVMLIVPEQFSHAAEKKLLEKVGAIRDNEVEVFSFEHLATATENRLGLPYSRKVNGVVKALVIKNVLTDGTFDFYKNAGERSGFVDLVSSAVSEFKKYMLTPEILQGVADNTKSEILRMKLNDLSKMYALYESSISEKYTDTSDALTILAKRIVDTDIYCGKHIFFDEFSTFVPQELEVIKALSQKAKSVCIALCYDRQEPNTTLFMPVIDTVEKLKKYIGKENITEDSDPKSEFKKSYFGSPQLAHLEKSLFTFPFSKYDGEGEDIKIFAMSNPLAEVENCAGQIKSLVRDKGYRYRDIGVICSDIETYRCHIERVFEYCDIEYFVDAKNQIINHHMVRFVLGLLEIYIKDYSYESIFNYLKACFVDANPADIAILEKFVKRAGIRRSTWLSDEKWNEVLCANYENEPAVMASLNKIRERYIVPLAKMHENIKGRNSVLHDATELYEYIMSLKMPDTIAMYIDKFNSEEEPRLAKEYEKIWEIITTTLDDVVHLNSERKVSPSAFYELLVIAFSQHSVGFLPSTIDRVTVGNIERTRLNGIKALFVLGTNEGVFPVAPKQDGVLGDADKDAMKDCGVDFSTTSSTAAYYSQYNAYAALTMPEEKLYISYCKTGNDFKPVRKSYIVERISLMFNVSEIGDVSFDNGFELHSEGPSREILAQKIADYCNGQGIDGSWRNVYEYFRDKGIFVQKLNHFLNSDNLVHRLSDKNLRELIPLLSYTSVSKIERYMACRYSYFLDYIIRPERPKDRNVDAIDIGNVAHAVLEKLSNEFALSRQSLEKCTDDQISSRTEELIDECIGEFTYGKAEFSPRDSYVIKRMKNMIVLCFKAVKNQIVESQFEPLGYEIEFGNSSQMGPIELKTDDGKTVKLTGKIDRADICKTEDGSYIRVIDYKTGEKELKLDEVFYCLNVQLMVYLGKLVSFDDEFRHGGAFYFKLSDTIQNFAEKKPTEEEVTEAKKESVSLKGIVPYDSKVISLYPDDFAEKITKTKADKRVMPEGFITIDEYLKKTIGKICGDVLRGNFEISPCKKGEKTACDFCNYASICRFDEASGMSAYTKYASMGNYCEIISEMEAAYETDNGTE